MVLGLFSLPSLMHSWQSDMLMMFSCVWMCSCLQLLGPSPENAFASFFFFIADGVASRVSSQNLPLPTSVQSFAVSFLFGLLNSSEIPKTSYSASSAWGALSQEVLVGGLLWCCSCLSSLGKGNKHSVFCFPYTFNN